MNEIYKITCQICDKIYIGKHHINERKPNNYFGSGKRQLQHLKEHKKENQIKQVLLYCEDKDVKYYEETLIKLYDATNPEIGLNISKKSKGLDKLSKEHKEKISKTRIEKGIAKGKNNPNYGKEGYWKGKNNKNHPMFGFHLTTESKQKIKENMPDRTGKNNPMYGMCGEKNPFYGQGLFEEKNGMFNKHHSEETKQKISKKLSKPVNAYIKKTNEYVETFESIKQCAKQLNLKSQHICNVLKNRTKSTKGYYFTYN